MIFGRYVGAGVLLLAASLFNMVSSGAVMAGTTTFTYDARGRLASASYSDGTAVCYSYDKAGNRTQFSSGSTGCSSAGSNGSYQDGFVLLTSDVSGSFTVPSGTPYIDVELWGAGGGASNESQDVNGNTSPANGGSAGGYTRLHLAAAGQVINFSIGAGGASCGSVRGGTSSVVTPALSATGGAGGQQSPRSGGTGSGGSTNLTGANGSVKWGAPALAGAHGPGGGAGGDSISLALCSTGAPGQITITARSS